MSVYQEFHLKNQKPSTGDILFKVFFLIIPKRKSA